MIAYTMMKNGTIVNGEAFTMTSADAAFPTLVAKLLPAGMKGLVVAGILAALMSSLASLFNSSAMLFTIDFYKRFKPDATESQLLHTGRIATVVIVILGILWIPVMKSVGSVLYAYLQDVQSVLAPGIAAAFLLGVLSKRITPKAGMWGLISGFIVGLTRLGAKVFYSTSTDATQTWFKDLFYDVNWLFFSGGMFVFSALVMIVVSMFTKQASVEQIQGLTFGSLSTDQKAITRASWNRWDVMHTVIIILITVAFYIYFW
jgi:SSS family solute:Na+ symporter